MKRFLSRIFRFGIMRRLRFGGRISITPSWACNYDCSLKTNGYDCSLKINGVYPKSPILPLDQWKKVLEEYDTATADNNGIKDVILSGGEPTLLPYFVELCHWILFEKKWFLTVFTNLSNLKWLEIKPSMKLRIGATYHKLADRDAFIKRYYIINKIHRVDVGEIGEKTLPFAKNKPCLTEEEICTLTANVRFAPDQSMHLNCRKMSVPFVD